MLRIRSRNMAEKLISVTPSNRPSSPILLQSRIRLRNQGSAGMRSGSGNVSSRYSQMRVDSMIALPSCRSVGTTPFGLSFSSLLKNPRQNESSLIQFFNHESVEARMRGAFTDQGQLFSYISPEARV